MQITKLYVWVGFLKHAVDQPWLSKQLQRRLLYFLIRDLFFTNGNGMQKSSRALCAASEPEACAIYSCRSDH